MSKKRPTLSDQIRQAITDCGETRYRIAKEAGISEAALGKFFHGERGLSLESLDKLAWYLELEVVSSRKKGRT